MVVAIFKLYLFPFDGELCVKNIGNIQVLYLTFLEFFFTKW